MVYISLNFIKQDIYLKIKQYSVIFETFRLIFDLMTLSMIIRYFYYFVG